jgi:hypothetical protein
MNSTVHVYLLQTSSWGNFSTNQDFNIEFFNQFPNVISTVVDHKSILTRYGFEKLLLRVELWDSQGYTASHRLSDILRLCLAADNSFTYIDLGTIFMDLSNPSIYKQSFVISPIWHDIGAALEVSNKCFCLPRIALLELIKRIIKRTSMGNNQKYHYYEIGSSMFPKILFNRYPMVLYSTNHPEQPYLCQIIKSTLKYKHKIFIESEFILRSWGWNYKSIITHLRNLLNYTSLDIPNVNNINTRYRISQKNQDYNIFNNSSNSKSNNNSYPLPLSDIFNLTLLSLKIK